MTDHYHALAELFSRGYKIKYSRKFGNPLITIENTRNRLFVSESDFVHLKKLACVRIDSTREFQYGDRHVKNHLWGKPVVETYFYKPPSDRQRKQAQSATF
jgi:hypothetical protein